MPPAVGQLGRRPTRVDRRTARLAPILASAPRAVIPGSPMARNWGRLVLANGDPGDEVQLSTFSNLRYGDCTCAALGHLDQVVAAATGAPATITTELVLEAYDDISGWDRSDPEDNDNGAHNLDALRWFKRRGMIEAYATIDETNRNHVETCINVFHGCYVGADLPLAAQKQAVWDVAPPGKRDESYDRRSWGGHAMTAVAYDHTGVGFSTWGRLQWATWPWFFSYVDEAYVAIHRGAGRRRPSAVAGRVRRGPDPYPDRGHQGVRSCRLHQGRAAHPRRPRDAGTLTPTISDAGVLRPLATGSAASTRW